jgi:hypothetical protein
MNGQALFSAEERVGDQTIVEIETCGVADETMERLRQISGVRSVGVETREHAQVVLVQSAVGAEIVPALLNELAGADIGNGVTGEPTLEGAYASGWCGRRDPRLPDRAVVARQASLAQRLRHVQVDRVADPVRSIAYYLLGHGERRLLLGATFGSAVLTTATAAEETKARRGSPRQRGGPPRRRGTRTCRRSACSGAFTRS